MNKRRAAWLVVAAAMLWGTYGSFLTLIESRGMGANVINFLRFASTFLPILALLLLRERGALLFRQKLSLAECLGIALVVAAVVGMNLHSKTQERAD